MISARALDHVALRVPDLDEVTEFYEQRLGFQLAAVTDGCRYLRTGAAGHHELVLEAAPEAGLDHFAFEVAERADLDRAVDDAARAGEVVARPPGEAQEPGHQASARLRDPDGNLVELVWAPSPVLDEEEASSVRPRKLGHVVLNTSRPEAMEAFYQRLGFRVSDRTARGMAFLRCGRDHHTLALMESARPGLQHVAYDFGDLDSVMQLLGAFTRDGIPCVWGPGRHGPGNNIFTYYQDPAGGTFECYAEMEQVADPDAEIKERYWGPEWGGDLWGLAGPAPAMFRG